MTGGSFRRGGSSAFQTRNHDTPPRSPGLTLQDLSSMTKDQLKSECRKRGYKTSGNKMDLVPAHYVYCRHVFHHVALSIFQIYVCRIIPNGYKTSSHLNEPTPSLFCTADTRYREPFSVFIFFFVEYI